MKRFASWSDAFAQCREMNRPIIALVDDEEAKIFPSGRWEPCNAAAVIAQLTADNRKAVRS